ncbi:flagellar filament capping protein FliD [Thalassotalea sp. G20_0]|uniref:flagellar filament capping protein FliD n=1 Tax=Thalassotalea sp. G20_0 TaxID=2821093 RepID=UPI001ADD5D5F|nr:flagellar filament capping protein FliD [Thalassotalea sp. G20_0]MBO9495223.1 flagellar filament capping protein FliD [Thalassotalea sp. G20_0]
MFSVSGIYSGLDITSMVTALVNAERAPTESRLNRNEQAYQVELSAVGTLKSSLESFQSQIQSLNSIEGFSPRAFTISDETAMGASVTSAAAQGSYTFTVEQMASRHQLASQAIDGNASIGVGTASFTVNGETFSVTLAAGSDTLTGLRDAINSSADNNSIQAVIINDSDQQRLMLTSRESGADYAISSDFSGLTGGSAALGSFTELQSAQDAMITFGSGASAITVTSPDNTLENLVDGVTIDLKTASTSPVTLDVTLDKEAVKTSIQSFVDTWNTLKTTFDQLTDYNGVSAGALNGDAQTRLLESQLRRELSQLFGDDGDPFRTLGDLGLKTTGTGELSIDNSRLDDALNGNFDELASALAGDSGLMTRLEERLVGFLGTDGALADREKRINESLNDINDDRADLELRLERTQSYYQQQFLAMENLLASLNGTSQWLTNNLTSINNSNNQ